MQARSKQVGMQTGRQAAGRQAAGRQAGKRASRQASRQAAGRQVDRQAFVVSIRKMIGYMSYMGLYSFLSQAVANSEKKKKKKEKGIKFLVVG